MPSPTPLRIGVFRDVALSLEMGEWLPVDGGALWRIDIAAANALHARLALEGVALADGASIHLSAPEAGDSVVGPIEGVGEFGNGTAWGLCAPGARTRLEWFVPSGGDRSRLPFRSVAYSHGYRDAFGSLRADAGDGGVAAGCSNDPVCYPAWANESNAGAKLIFSSNGATYTCSGQLLATTAADETPYLSTANHCISTQASANSCQCIFFYRRTVCGGGVVQNGSSVTGADLAANSPASDCTLLLVRPILPTTVFFAGWTGSSVPTGTASTGIHHPSGTEQAISFGNKVANAYNCGSPTGNWSAIGWTNGITESGSSGSAIYRTSDKKLYGVLTCGTSACNNTAGQDGYGRWDLAVSSGGFGTLLAAGSDDVLEPNDTCATAKPVTAGTTYPNLIVKRLDEDWYSIPAPPSSIISVNMTFTHANGDVDVELYGSCGGAPVLQRLGNTNNEVFTYTNATSASTILMRVFLGAGTRNTYAFSYTIATPQPQNDECVTATPILSGAFPFDTSAATDSAVAIAPSCTDGAGNVIHKDVWFRYAATCNGTATASTCNSAPFDTRLVVYNAVACPTATSTVLACNDNASGCGTTSAVTFTVRQGYLYFIRLGSKATVGGAGTLTVTCTPGPVCAADVNGSGSVDASDLAIVLGSWGACGGCPADVNGNGTVDAGDLAAILGAWGACP